MNSVAELFVTEPWQLLKQEQERKNSQRIARQRKKREILEAFQLQLDAAGILLDEFLDSDAVRCLLE